MAEWYPLGDKALTARFALAQQIVLDRLNNQASSAGSSVTYTPVTIDDHTGYMPIFTGASLTPEAQIRQEISQWHKTITEK